MTGETGEQAEFLARFIKGFFSPLSLSYVSDITLDNRRVRAGRIDVADKLNVYPLPVLCLEREIFIPDIVIFLELLESDL